MIEINQILCPVDLSEFSRGALQHAVAIARRYESTITALHVLPPINTTPELLAYASPVFPGTVEVQRLDHGQLTVDLQRFVDEATVGAVPVRAVVADGPIVAGIVNQAEAMPADLIVMGTHGRSGFERLLLGSVTEKVLRKTNRPVLTVPKRAVAAETVGSGLFKRVLCPVDFSDASLNALRYAMSLAQEADAQLTVMHVLEMLSHYQPYGFGTIDLAKYQREYEQSVRKQFAEIIPASVRDHCTVAEVFAVGKAYAEILRVAADHQTELIVIGIHGRGAADLAFFGSTTQHVLRQAACPVLTLRA